MRIALLGTGPVGREAARLLAERKADVALLVLDAREPDEGIVGIFPSGPRAVARSGSHRDERLAAEFERHQIDLGILAWWPYLLHTRAISVASTAMLNFHPSLLPHCRGKDPNFWALVEGRPFGVTIHHVTEAADEGPIAFQRELPTSWLDSGGSLFQRARQEMVNLFADHLDEILAGQIPMVEQQLAMGSSHRRADLEPSSRISLDSLYSGRALLNLLRARTFPPHPGAWFDDEGVRYEVRVEIHEIPDRDEA